MAAQERLICPSTALIEGGEGVRFEVERFGERQPAFLVRFRGNVQGYLNRCAHVPMELDWQPRRFFDVSGLYLVCATHGALYSPESGRCMGGRCDGRGLVKLVVVERDGAVYLQESD